MKKQLLLFATIGSAVITPHLRADVLELKNGTILNGKYAGGTAGTVRFDTDAGTQVIETAQIIALTFTTPAPAVAAPPPVAAAPAASPQSVTLPAGTTLLVRTLDSISSRDRPGATFTTKLEYDLAAGSAVGVKGGTLIYGRVQSSSQAGRAVGQSTLDIRLTQMVINGQPAPIMTGNYQEAGQRSIAKAAKGAAAGAAIGAIAGNAGKGAAIGATAGALTRGQTLTITPGTLLEFTLQQPVTVSATP
ncbi:MAG TPA: glycine zipper family protein [Candidatus Acidoferrum sp.]|jgi:hypothetical protein|nr:glycine zipper family protein [Candidatus Acidoferrum sp.]